MNNGLFTIIRNDITCYNYNIGNIIMHTSRFTEHGYYSLSKRVYTIPPRVVIDEYYNFYRQYVIEKSNFNIMS